MIKKIRISLWCIPVMIIMCFFNIFDIYFFTICVGILHECGHLIVAKIFKYEILSINILPIGISASIVKFDENRSYKFERLEKYLIIVSGVFVNFIILLVGLYFNNYEIVYINLIFICVNIISIYPLDGGRLIKIILSKKYKGLDLISIVDNISRIVTYLFIMFSSFLIIFLKSYLIIVFDLFLIFLRFNEKRKIKLKFKVYNSVKYVMNNEENLINKG